MIVSLELGNKLVMQAQNYLLFFKVNVVIINPEMHSLRFYWELAWCCCIFVCL